MYYVLCIYSVQFFCETNCCCFTVQSTCNLKTKCSCYTHLHCCLGIGTVSVYRRSCSLVYPWSGCSSMVYPTQPSSSRGNDIITPAYCNVSWAELPTSTFLPYFVRFLKENTAVRFFLQKYVFQNFVFFFFFFFYTREWKFWNLHTLFMLWKLGQSFWILMFKNKAKIAPEST